MKNYAERVADAAIKAKARKDAGATSTAKQAS